MIIVTVENICKSYGEKTLFKDVSFTISDEDKIGLIGVNGTGKSSLLKIVTGEDSLMVVPLLFLRELPLNI